MTSRQARRMRREFARVGVCVSADRLREITAGAAASEEERTDIEFAMAVTEKRIQKQLNNIQRRRDQLVRLNIALWSVVALRLTAVLSMRGLHVMSALLDPAAR